MANLRYSTANDETFMFVIATTIILFDEIVHQAFKF